MSELTNNEPARQLLDRIVGFGRYLRARGMPVNLAQTLDLVRAVGEVGLEREDFYLSARATLVTRKEDLPAFDEAFEEYWRSQSPQEISCPAPQEVSCPEEEQARQPSEAGADGEGSGEEMLLGLEEEGGPEDAESETVPVYSPVEVLRDKDFARMSPEEAMRARELMRGIDWCMGTRLSRRTLASRRGSYLDLRRTLRSNVQHGEAMEIGRRERKLKPRPLVLICDISGSMECYTRLLLQFLHAVEHGGESVETFVFGTRLTRITRQLRARDVDQALEAVSAEVLDWAGGTCIGESLHAFNTRWARRVLRRGATVIIISDGWDRGDTELLRGEMERLQRSCHRLIWLNPLLGSPSYQPLTRGIQAALPYVDDFLSVHNLRSLEELASRLSEVGAVRPERRQAARVRLSSEVAGQASGR